MYLTFSEYAAYGGTITDETTFNDIEFEAQTIVDWYTFNRLQKEVTLTEPVKRCVYKIIQFIQAQSSVNGIGNPDETSSDGVGAGIASQSNDGVSISYNVLSAKEVMENSKAQIEQIVRQYLSSVTNSLGHKVLYRGIYPDE